MIVLHREHHALAYANSSSPREFFRAFDNKNADDSLLRPHDNGQSKSFVNYNSFIKSTLYCIDSKGTA